MPRIADHPELKKDVQVILQSIPEHLRILVNGQIEAILIKYESECSKALINLRSEIGKLSDWMDDGLRKAIEQADKLV